MLPSWFLSREQGNKSTREIILNRKETTDCISQQINKLDSQLSSVVTNVLFLPVFKVGTRREINTLSIITHP